MKNHDLEVLFLRFRDAGDMLALAKVFDNAAPQLLPVAVHLAARRDEADDLVQATFLTAIERANSYERGRPVLPWLLGILALHARKLREKQGRLLDLERVHQREESGPEQLAAAGEVRQAVDAAVRELPTAYAGIVRRHLVDGLEPGELAGELGLSSGAARVRLHRGLKLLRRALPAAFSTGGYAATSSRGIESIREAVMERASLLTGSPIPAAGFAPLGVILALLAPLMLALPAWLVWRSPEATEPAEAALATAPESIATELAPTSAAESIEALARVEAESNPSSPTPPSAMIGDAIVRGRLLRPDGSPAVGSRVNFSGTRANQERVQQYGLPTNWIDPQPKTADADGRFEFSFDPPLAYQFFMKVDEAGSAMAAWRWNTLLPGSTLELGDIALEPVATIVAHIVDASSNSLCIGWNGSVDVQPLTAAQGRDSSYISAKCLAGASEIVLSRVPARRVRLEASTENGASIEAVIVDLVANETKSVELRYDGPDPAKRIAVRVSTSPYYSFDSGHLQVSATSAGAPPLIGSMNENGLMAYVIDGCVAGAYDLSISDPRLVPWTKSNVQPGEVVRAKLVGNAALRLHLNCPDGSAYLSSYSLRAKFTSGHSSNEFVLVAPNAVPPTGGVIGGVIPGDYALTLEIADLPPQNIAVLGLAPNEVRDVNCNFAAGLALQGTVYAADGTTPLSNVEVQLTRGDQAGHAGDVSVQIFAGNGIIRRFTQSTATDEQGRYTFNGLTAEHWTLRASWSEYLHVDRIVALDGETQPLVILRPAHGFLTGRLLIPAGAPIDDTNLLAHFSPMDPTLRAFHAEGRDNAVLHEDGAFDFGALPVGEVQLNLAVTTVAPDGASESGPRTVYTAMIHDGETLAAEIDLRNTFPGRLRERVVIDDLAASGGTLLWAVAGSSPTGAFSRSVHFDGTALLGSLAPGSLRLDYWSKDKTWAWSVAQPITIVPGQEVAHEIQLHTTARDLRCVDVSGGAVLANVEIEWRTGLGGKELTAKARTDAAGLLHLRMPDQNVETRCVGDVGAFTMIAWGAGNGPLTVALRRAP